MSDPVLRLAWENSWAVDLEGHHLGRVWYSVSFGKWFAMIDITGHAVGMSSKDAGVAFLVAGPRDDAESLKS
jgi:hypothetical protein